MKTLAQTRLAVPAVAALAVCALGSSALANFNYSDFSTTAGLNMVGVAKQDADRILVTPSIGASAGAVWAVQKQNISHGFDAYMTIHIEDLQGIGADGMALVIQNSAVDALGGGGGAIGYGTNPTFGLAGIENSIAVAFDMWDNNANWPEPGNNHVTVQTRGLLQNSPELAYSLGNAATPDLSDGANHYIHVNYTPGIMSVYLDNALTPTLQVAVDIGSLLSLDNGQAWVGVTAATGGPWNAQAHVLDSFAFSGCPVPTPGTAGLMALGGLVGFRRRRN
ncbi:MAG TPA: L-type lectin-domain containing protein [Phycisphaerales bacterium]|nr:L-type lectin-domain containing protein [Phycisphaerales bacterium]